MERPVYSDHVEGHTDRQTDAHPSRHICLRINKSEDLALTRMDTRAAAVSVLSLHLVYSKGHTSLENPASLVRFRCMSSREVIVSVLLRWKEGVAC